MTSVRSEVSITEALFEQVSINGLGGGGTIARCDDHLAIGRCNASSRVEAGNAGALFAVHHHLPIDVQFRSELSRKMVVKDIAPGGK